MPTTIDNFNVRFKSIHKLEEPNHQAVMRLVQERVKSGGEKYIETYIKSKSDVTEEYLSGKKKKKKRLKRKHEIDIVL